MLQYKDLLQICIEGLNNFDQQTQSVEEYIKSFLKTQKGLDDDDHTFIVEVFSGCIQHTKLLEVVVEGFFITDGKNSLRVDTSLYSILCYMIMFRLDELGISHFSKFIDTQRIGKMYRFLQFFLNNDNLLSWIRDQWCQQYDSQFVDEKIIKNILRWKEPLDEIVAKLQDTVNNRIALKYKKIPPTKPKPFNLTQPKPRSIPLPHKVPPLQKTKAFPHNVFKEPKEIDSLKNIKMENQRKAEMKLLEANEDQFVCAHPEKSLKTQKKIKTIIEGKEKELQFNKKHTRQLPQYVVENRPIKLNAAAILREGALFQRKEKEELEKLEKLLRGEKDATEFFEWQKSMQEKDKDEKLLEDEQRRVLGKLSREEAILARQNKTKENKAKVSQMKFETAKMMQDYLALRLDEEKQMRDLVEQIIQGHHDAQNAQVKLREYKRKIVQEVNMESREMMRKALEDAEEEMKRKSQLIQQIRAMETVPTLRQKFVDFTSTAGHALLSEMSLTELHERLCLMKEEQQKQEDEKRDAIIKEKQAKTEAIMETIARISVHRNELNKAAKMRSEEKERLRKVQEDKLKQNDSLIALQSKLQQKKEERMRGSEEAIIKPNPYSLSRTKGLIREKKNMERKRWHQLELGQEKMAERRIRDSPSTERLSSQRNSLLNSPALKVL